MKKRIGVTKNGFDVYVILDNEHMLAHASVKEELIAEAIPKITFTPPHWMAAVEMGYIVGKNACVTVSAEDDVRDECRPGRVYPSRIVYGKTPEDTSLLTVGLCTDDDGLCTVFTAFAGPKAPKELTDPTLKEGERAEAEAFWKTHALCAGF